ncbi:DUF2651 family protein [Bacillus safensis]|uniref:DUF2651 family protein n=1 Tax=Bacillus safensis TaxID=561879 RepID=UPI0009B95D0B|nr:DUF2651 family protein [Bacillus safensis]
MTHLEFAFSLLPISIIVVSFIGTLIIQKIYFMPVLSFMILFILTFTLFNASFLGWAIVYTLFSFITSFIALFIINIKRNPKLKSKSPFKGFLILLWFFHWMNVFSQKSGIRLTTIF